VLTLDFCQKENPIIAYQNNQYINIQCERINEHQHNACSVASNLEKNKKSKASPKISNPSPFKDITSNINIQITNNISNNKLVQFASETIDEVLVNNKNPPIEPIDDITKIVDKSNDKKDIFDMLEFNFDYDDNKAEQEGNTIFKLNKFFY
jgi:hypothetical protein